MSASAAPDQVAVHLVTGSDPTLVGQAVDRLLDVLVGEADRSMVVESFDDPDDYQPAAVADAAQTPPFLADRRVVVARGIGTFNTQALAPLLAYLESPLETTRLVLVHDAGGRLAPALTKAVKAAGSTHDAGAPARKPDREQWWSARIAESGLHLDKAARRRIDEHLGEDLGRAQSLLEVLAAAHGPGARLGEAEVAPFLGAAGGIKPWDLTDAIDRGDTAAALAALERLTQAGGFHALQTMGVLANHFGRAIRLQGSPATNEKAAAEILGLKGSTFPARKALALARTLGADGARRAAIVLADADLEIRGVRQYGPAQDQLVMELLVARLCQLCRTGTRAGSGR